LKTRQTFIIDLYDSVNCAVYRSRSEELT